ncbi:hypothetical protein COO60DRAFT_733325 [Scenedesmus sp. NREL 46B-D3]|nr:hypothetical protein COO60DRAFT_733325 [Scenedesmus sp. NREL 46B-D3]
MEVIGAGWGRTGTMSLKVALDELGLPCYHMVECFKHPGHAEQWTRAAGGHPVDFRQLLDGCGYKACTDWPPAAFYKQLMELYPEAKVILSVRNPDKWYESTKETIWQINEALRHVPWYVARAQQLLLPGRSRAVHMVRTLVWEHDLQGCFADDPRKAKELFKQHIEEVKQVRRNVASLDLPRLSIKGAAGELGFSVLAWLVFLLCCLCSVATADACWLA